MKVRFRRWIVGLGAAALLAVALGGCDPFDGPNQPLVQGLNARPNPEWYDRAKVGVMIHWGAYAIPGMGEWYWEEIVNDPTMAQWHADHYGADFPYAEFGAQWRDIIDQSTAWDARAWAQLFAAAGARYVVLTTKHHDGFLLWPSAHPSPKIADWQLTRDVAGELADAVRAAGLRFGVYYSGGHDWTWRMQHGSHPLDQLMAHLDNEDERAYIDAHFRELIARYRPSVLWNDIGFPKGDSFDLKWELIRDYYRAVPDGLINDRFLDTSFIERPLERNPWLVPLLEKLLPLDARGKMAPAAAWLEALRGLDFNDLMNLYKPPHYDFSTWEFSVPDGIPLAKWERPRTLGQTWGYNRNDTPATTLSGPELIAELADVVAKGGNYLVNVGPTADGQITEMQRASLTKLGAWLRVNGAAIYDSAPWIRFDGETAAGATVRFTRNADRRTVYAIVLTDRLDAETDLRDFDFDLDGVELLGAGPCPGWRPNGRDLIIEAPRGAPAESAYVFALRLTGIPQSDDDESSPSPSSLKESRRGGCG